MPKSHTGLLADRIWGLQVYKFKAIEELGGEALHVTLVKTVCSNWQLMSKNPKAMRNR